MHCTAILLLCRWRVNQNLRHQKTRTNDQEIRTPHQLILLNLLKYDNIQISIDLQCALYCR